MTGEHIGRLESLGMDRTDGGDLVIDCAVWGEEIDPYAWYRRVNWEDLRGNGEFAEDSGYADGLFRRGRAGGLG